MRVTHKPRDNGNGQPLVTRQAAAVFAKRHPDQVTRYCEPVACDVTTKVPLYDLDAALNLLATLRRRTAA